MTLSSPLGHGMVGVGACSPRVLPNPPGVVRRVFSSPGATSSLSKPGTPCTTSSPLIGTTFSQAPIGALAASRLLSSPVGHRHSHTTVRSSSLGTDVHPSRLLEGAERNLGSSLRASSSAGSNAAVFRRLSPRRNSGAIDSIVTPSESDMLRAGSPRRWTSTAVRDNIQWQDMPTLPTLPIRRGSSLCAPPSSRGSLCAPPSSRGSSLCAPPNIELSSGSNASAQLRMAPKLPQNIAILPGKVMAFPEKPRAPHHVEPEPSTGRSTATDLTDVATFPIGTWTFNMAEALQNGTLPPAPPSRRSQESRRNTEVIGTVNDVFNLETPLRFGFSESLTTSPLPLTPAFPSIDMEGHSSEVMSGRAEGSTCEVMSARVHTTYCEQELLRAPNPEATLLAEAPPLQESEATLPGPAAAEQDTDATSESSVEVLPGATDASQSPGAYICEVSIVGADLGPLFDTHAFHSAVSFSNFFQSNASVLSEKPHRFVVHTKEDLADNFVQVVLQPRDDEGGVTLELETFFPLSYIAEQVGYGEAHTLTLCLLPRGSGATPSSIFRHCANLQFTSGIAAGSGGAALSKIILTCSVQERLGSLWRSDPELEYLPEQWMSPTACDESIEVQRDVQARQCLQRLPPVPAATTTETREETGDVDEVSLQQREWGPEQHGSDAVRFQQGNHDPTSPMTDGWDDEQEQMWLHEELKRARNELRMQQTLMNFQERRLQVFEAQSNAVAAAGAASLAYDASLHQAHDPNSNLVGVQEQLRHLGDQMHTQQEEILRLREQLACSSPGCNFLGNPRQQPMLQEQNYQRYPPEIPARANHLPPLTHRDGVEQALLHEVEAREKRISELERLLRERDQQLDMIPDAVESILRSPPPPHSLEALAPMQKPFHEDFRTTPIERSPVKPWEALPRQFDPSFKNGEGDHSSRLSHYSPRPASYDGLSVTAPTGEHSSIYQGLRGSLPPAPQVQDVGASGHQIEPPSTDRSENLQDDSVRAYKSRATITDNSPGHHPAWDQLWKENAAPLQRRSTHLKGNVVNEYRLQTITPRPNEVPAIKNMETFADDFGITPATLARPSCHFLGDDATNFNRPAARSTIPIAGLDFSDISSFPTQAAMTNGLASGNNSATAPDGNVSLYSSLKQTPSSGSHLEARSSQHVKFHDSVCLPQNAENDHFFKRRSTSPVSASLGALSERRSSLNERSVMDGRHENGERDAVVLGEHSAISPEANIEMLQYTPEDPNDMLDAILAECITYLQIPKTALGDSSITRVSSGVYRLGPCILRLKQLDGGIYMQQGPQDQQREFGDWLLGEARRNMQQITRSFMPDVGATSNSDAEQRWNVESQVEEQRQRCDTICSSTSHVPRLSPRNAEALFSQRVGTSDSPTSAKRSLNFLQSPEAISFPKFTNIELDIQIDIGADSTGATGTTMDFQGPSSPTSSPTSSTFDCNIGSGRSE